MIFKDVVILRIDGEPDFYEETFTMNTDITYPEEIPVYTTPVSGHFIGMAKNVRRIDGLIVADIHMYKQDKIPFEVFRHLKPCVSGVKFEKEGKAIKKSKITGIELAPYNADKRIKPLSGFSIEGFVK